MAWSIEGDTDRAIADFDGAIKFDPRNALVYANLVRIWAASGDRDRPNADFGQTIELDATQPTDMRDVAVQRELALQKPRLTTSSTDAHWTPKSPRPRNLDHHSRGDLGTSEQVPRG